MDQATSDRNPTRFNIQMSEVDDAFEQVRRNQGGAGVDAVSIAEFMKDLDNQKYKIWNRLNAGCYIPPLIRRVDIPKPDGRMRPLGIPTVGDRVAQTVIKNRLEPILEKRFLPDSYGCRPGKQAHDALRRARLRCWKYDWGVDLDIKGYFDNIPHDLLMKALRKCTNDRVILLYCERWLKARVFMPDGTVGGGELGTPQGGVISPLLANLFLHYAFDRWMEGNFPSVPFERYVDDAICHCKNKAQAEFLLQELHKRMGQCGLELHPVKTKIFYCKDGNRRGEYETISFDFLGYSFMPRQVISRAKRRFLGFTPAVSQKAKKKMAADLKELRIPSRTNLELHQIARLIEKKVIGWINYYGKFQPSRLKIFLSLRIDCILARWAVKKYKRLKGSMRQALGWIKKIRRKYPKLVVHWYRFENMMMR